MEKLRENPLEMFTSAIRQLTQWANGGQDPDNKPMLDWEKFSLDNLVSCFSQENADTFLTDAPLEAYLGAFVPNEFTLQGWIPEGTRLTLSVLPCDLKGRSFEKKQLDDQNSKNFPYFQVFYSNASHNSGMALGIGSGVKAAPYLKTVPEEIRLQCSFVIEYRAGTDRLDNETDFQYFSRMVSEKYHRLQEIFKGRMV